MRWRAAWAVALSLIIQFVIQGNFPIETALASVNRMDFPTKPSVMTNPIDIKVSNLAKAKKLSIESHYVLPEPPRDCRRPIYLSYAAMGILSIAA